MLLKIISLSVLAWSIFQNPAVTSTGIRDVPLTATVTQNPETSLPLDAQRSWEQVVAAKGGRERLHAVRNFVISSRAGYRTSLSKKNQIRQEAFYVLPNKSWVWNDLRPDVFGLRITMYNYDTKMKYVISEGDPHHAPERMTESETNRLQMYGLLSYLPETRWVKPEIVKASVGRIGLRSVDIVETRVNGERVDFACDQETHLPVRVSYYSVEKNRTYVSAVDLSDYVEINEIKVPQTIRYDDGTEYKQRYQFNVEYNEEIFVKPPSIEAGPEAWKIAKR